MRPQWPVVGGVGGAQACDVVALGQLGLPGVIPAPAAELAEFGEGDVQLAAGGFVVGVLVEQPGDDPELLLGQRQHGAPACHVVHRPQLTDHGGEPVGQTVHLPPAWLCP